MRRHTTWAWVAVSSLLLVTSCGGEPARDGIRPDPEMLGGKADLASWMVLKQEKPGCGSELTGEMKGFDSAFAYPFETVAGTLYTFDFVADYSPDRGAVVAVYDPQGNLVQRERNLLSQRASLTFAAQSDGVHHVAVYSVRWWAAGAYSLKTTCGVAGLNQLTAGQSSFTTFEQQPYHWGLEGSGPLSTAATREAAPKGRTGEVEEGDIYRVDGNRLYYFNTYRGLMIFDISDTKQPRLEARVPVYGYPIEMYVENSKVYALVRDALYLTREPEGRLRFNRRNVSQLVTIAVPQDLTTAKPQVMSTFDIIGQLREGVSRKIDNTIYVVSYQPRWYYWGWNNANEQPTEQAWVYAYNVADPNDVKQVDSLQIFEGGNINVTHDDGTVVRENFSSVAISATSNALMVVENWSSYSRSVPGGDYTCSQSQWLNKAKVSIVDISDPTGKIRLHTKFETYGQLGDQFKQTYTLQGSKAVYLGIFARREWSYSDCSGQSHIENTLESWDVTDGDNPVRLDKLSFGKKDETVRGSIFDADRDVAFAITARNVDPLYALSYANPADLKVLSEVDGLSGDMNVFRPIADGKFLIAIGRDNSDACTGFDGPATGWATKVAVSLIDVQDLSQIRLAQRQCVAVKDAEWFGSQVNWNLDQAHKMIGMHSDGMVNVVTVPVYYSKKVDDPARSWWWYRHETAVGVMSWDLTRYNPALPETQQDVLRNHGTVVHPNGQVRRSIVFTHKGLTSRRKMINLSDTHMSLTDMQDLDSPTGEAVVELAPYVASIHRVAGGAYVVEQVKSEPWAWGEGDASEFRVRATAGNLEDNPVLASFTVSQVERVLPFGDDTLVLIRRVRDPADEGTETYWYGQWKKQAVIYDLSNPTQPTFAGAVALPMSYITYYRYWCGTPPFWFSHADANGWSPTSVGLVFLSSQYDWQTNVSKRSLVLLDLRNRFAPGVLEQPLPGDADLTFVGISADEANDAVLVSYKKHLGSKEFDGQSFAEYQYFTQRWRVAGGLFGADAPINLPGRLVRAMQIEGKPMLLAQDNAFEKTAEGAFRSHPRLNLLWLAQDGAAPVAMLQDSQSFTGMYLKDLVLDGRELYVNAREGYDYYWGPIPLEAASEPKKVTGDQLMVFRLSSSSFSQLYGEDTQASNLEIMGAYQGSLFLSLAGDGVMVVDVTTPWKPEAKGFVRTLGYATHVQFAAGSALVASGYYGVYQIDLQSASKLAVDSANN